MIIRLKNIYSLLMSYKRGILTLYQGMMVGEFKWKTT